MNLLKRTMALGLSLLLALSLTACGQKETPDSPEPEQPAEEQAEVTPASYRIAALKGPTAMGLVKLMNDAENGGVV